MSQNKTLDIIYHIITRYTSYNMLLNMFNPPPPPISLNTNMSTATIYWVNIMSEWRSVPVYSETDIFQILDSNDRLRDTVIVTTLLFPSFLPSFSLPDVLCHHLRQWLVAQTSSTVFLLRFSSEASWLLHRLRKLRVAYFMSVPIG